MTSFERVDYPGKPKILFVGIANSTHTHSWIDLLKEAPFNVRLFSTTEGLPPDDWPVRTYVTAYHSGALDPAWRMRLFDQGKATRLAGRTKAWLSRKAWDVSSFVPAWLIETIQTWRPDVIHTLGLDAGAFYLSSRERLGAAKIGKWVLQTRGGSDLALTHLDPERVPQIAYVLRACDQLLCDNFDNLRIARELGLAESHFASIAPVPGTGGIDVDELAGRWPGPPSQRRTILWPKAYETPWGKVTPTFEAIKLCWDRIQPVEIQALSADAEARAWYWTLPENIRRSFRISERVTRAHALDLMTKARVMLAPSLVDGVPNSMYEAMAAGAFPIVSPLDTIRPLVENETNVLFARNLYPNEIADALCRAMSDDALVDAAAQRNLALARRIADRSKIKTRVIEYYERLAG